MGRRNTGPTPAVVDAVLERAMHSCEVCTAGLGDRRGEDYHVHHRRPRQMGGTRRPGTNYPGNLLVLCPDCHEQIESNRAIAYDMGWLVPQNEDPKTVAVLVQRDQWKYLTDDAGYADEPVSV